MFFLNETFSLILGIAGATAFAISAVPQAYLSWRQGHSKGLSNGLLFLWFFGEGSMIIRGLDVGYELLLMANYVFNFLCLSVILRYKFFPRRDDE